MSVPENKSDGKGSGDPDLRGPAADASGHPLGEMDKILDSPPVVNGEVLRGDTRLTRRWSHGALHNHLPGMKGHVVITFYGAAQEIIWRGGGSRQASRTRQGSITLIPENHPGDWDIAGPLEVSHVYLTDERVQNTAELLAHGRRVELIDRVGFDDSATANILAMLSLPSVTADPASRLFVEQAVDLLCTQLVRAHSSIAMPAQAPPRRGLADWQVKRVTSYMRDFLDRDIGLEEMAGLVDLSRFHFVTAFRLATGLSPHHYLTAMRMTEARKLLAQLELPIIQVALAVGYQTPSAFTASFRKATSQTPSEFRKGL